ncbi:MAG: hypothetical protein ABWX67_17310 [Allosphingosinicella sp.]
MSLSPPLRFLAIVLGGWAALRTAAIAPPWTSPPTGAAAAQPRASPRAVVQIEARPMAGSVDLATKERERFSPVAPAPVGSLPMRSPPRHATLLPPLPDPRIATAMASPPLPRRWVPPLLSAPGRAASGRWSLSAWAFVRQGDSAALAAGGLLGGSQAGARLTFRLNRDRARPLALSARLTAPLRRPSGAEAALGLDWRPVGRLPVRLLAERRQALGREGRSAFALTLYGGIGEVPLGRFRIDAYAQAGMVGARSRDPFGDGSIRLSLPLNDKLRLGAGAWAAAQPGLARLDLGPQATLRLPVAGRPVTLAADWRLRVAGNAGPGSGPTVTIGTDF